MPSAANLFAEARRESPATLPTPERALAIGAHPDDAEFGAGGTLARWAQEGCEVSILVATDGSKGTWNPDQTPEELSTRRRHETEQAAEILGARGEIVFLDHIDGELIHSTELQRELCWWIRRLRPDVIVGWDPWKRYMLHPDHREIGWATIDAVVAARDHLFFPDQLVDGLTKHRPEALLLYSPDRADHWEDVAATFDIKIDALLCHTSQSQTTMQDAVTDAEGRERFRARIHDWCSEMGAAAGLELAEAYKLIRP